MFCVNKAQHTRTLVCKIDLHNIFFQWEMHKNESNLISNLELKETKCFLGKLKLEFTEQFKFCSASDKFNFAYEVLRAVLSL